MYKSTIARRARVAEDSGKSHLMLCHIEYIEQCHFFRSYAIKFCKTSTYLSARKYETVRKSLIKVMMEPQSIDFVYYCVLLYINFAKKEIGAINI